MLSGRMELRKMLQSEYTSKKTTLDYALSLIRSGDMIVVGGYGNEPSAFLGRLHSVAGGLTGVELCAGTFHEPYPFLADTGLNGKLDIISFFYSPQMRALHSSGRANLIPADLHSTGSILMSRKKPRICVAAVTPMDEEGYFYLSTSLLLEYEMLDVADVIIFEVNKNIPRLFGKTKVHVDKVTCYYEADSPLPELSPCVYTQTDYSIADFAASLINDGDTIQLGVGGVPSSLPPALSNHRDLGVHTEFLGAAIGELMEKGIVNNSKKNLHQFKSVCAFTGGSQHLYDFLDGNEDVLMLPAVYVNDPVVIAQNDNFVSVNTALEVDLTGQICSESIGSLQYSGTGGASDFARGALDSRGGRSMIVIHSTACNGSISKIKAQLTPGAVVSISRNAADYVITEYGIARLRGATIRERAQRLIGIAHPHFRTELTRQARDLLLW